MTEAERGPAGLLEREEGGREREKWELVFQYSRIRERRLRLTFQVALEKPHRKAVKYPLESAEGGLGNDQARFYFSSIPLMVSSSRSRTALSPFFSPGRGVVRAKRT